MFVYFATFFHNNEILAMSRISREEFIKQQQLLKESYDKNLNEITNTIGDSAQNPFKEDADILIDTAKRRIIRYKKKNNQTLEIFLPFIAFYDTEDKQGKKITSPFKIFIDFSFLQQLRLDNNSRALLNFDHSIMDLNKQISALQVGIHEYNEDQKNIKKNRKNIQPEEYQAQTIQTYERMYSIFGKIGIFTQSIIGILVQYFSIQDPTTTITLGGKSFTFEDLSKDPTLINSVVKISTYMEKFCDMTQNSLEGSKYQTFLQKIMKVTNQINDNIKKDFDKILQLKDFQEKEDVLPIDIAVHSCKIIADIFNESIKTAILGVNSDYVNSSNAEAYKQISEERIPRITTNLHLDIADFARIKDIKSNDVLRYILLISQSSNLNIILNYHQDEKINMETPAANLEDVRNLIEKSQEYKNQMEYLNFFDKKLHNNIYIQYSGYVPPYALACLMIAISTDGSYPKQKGKSLSYKIEADNKYATSMLLFWNNSLILPVFKIKSKEIELILSEQQNQNGKLAKLASLISKNVTNLVSKNEEYIIPIYLFNISLKMEILGLNNLSQFVFSQNQEALLSQKIHNTEYQGLQKKKEMQKKDIALLREQMSKTQEQKKSKEINDTITKKEKELTKLDKEIEECHAKNLKSTDFKTSISTTQPEISEVAILADFNEDREEYQKICNQFMSEENYKTKHIKFGKLNSNNYSQILGLLPDASVNLNQISLLFEYNFEIFDKKVDIIRNIVQLLEHFSTQEKDVMINIYAPYESVEKNINIQLENLLTMKKKDEELNIQQENKKEIKINFHFIKIEHDNESTSQEHKIEIKNLEKNKTITVSKYLSVNCFTYTGYLTKESNSTK